MKSLYILESSVDYSPVGDKRRVINKIYDYDFGFCLFEQRDEFYDSTYFSSIEKTTADDSVRRLRYI